MKEKYIIIILFVVIIAACSIYGSISQKIDNLNMVIHDQDVLINYQDSIIMRFSYCED